MRAVFALYAERYGEPFVWPTVSRLTRKGRCSLFLATRTMGGEPSERVVG
jgi:hypothetical protein